VEGYFNQEEIARMEGTWRTKANKAYAHWMVIFLVGIGSPEQQQKNREKFAWVLKRKSVLYELGRINVYLSEELGEQFDSLHLIRWLAGVLCENRPEAGRPKAVRAAAYLREARLSGKIKEVAAEFARADRDRQRKAQARDRGQARSRAKGRA
jgi:hypothetical protein